LQFFISGHLEIYCKIISVLKVIHRKGKSERSG
jgi:hypothetical protein